jgi:DNA-binding MarR family transcriptional regulator
MYLLNQASLQVRSHLEAALRDLQMTGIQFTALGNIKDHEGISSAELARRFFVTAQTTNEIINGLEKRGLLVRKEDPANKRILRMKLTPKGRKLYKQCDKIADSIEAAAFDWVTPDDHEALRDSLRALLRGLRERGPLLKVPETGKRPADAKAALRPVAARRTPATTRVSR